MPKIEIKPLSWFKPDPNQPRKSFDEAELRQLGESLKKGQLRPIFVQPDGTIIAGERSWRAAKLADLPTLEAKIADRQLSESEVRIWQLVENMLRAGLTGYEQWTGCYELMCMNPAWQMKDLAENLSLDPSTVTRILSPSKCIEAVQDALKDGKIGISDCYAISKLPADTQAGLLALKLSGASRDQMERAGRRQRSQATAAVRASKIRIALTSGATVTISGDEISLDDAIEAAKDALKEMTKGRDQGLDAKTLVAVCRDKAKAG